MTRPLAALLLFTGLAVGAARLARRRRERARHDLAVSPRPRARPVRARAVDDALQSRRCAPRRRRRAAGEPSEDRLLLRLSHGERPEAPRGHAHRRPRGALDRPLPGRALLASVPRLRPDVPPVHVAGADPASGGPAAAELRQSRGLRRRRPGVAHVPAQVQPRPRRRPRSAIRRAPSCCARSSPRRSIPSRRPGGCSSPPSCSAATSSSSAARTSAATSSTSRRAAPRARSGAWWPSRPSISRCRPTRSSDAPPPRA